MWVLYLKCCQNGNSNCRIAKFNLSIFRTIKRKIYKKKNFTVLFIEKGLVSVCFVFFQLQYIFYFYNPFLEWCGCDLELLNIYALQVCTFALTQNSFTICGTAASYLRKLQNQDRRPFIPAANNHN